jgi:hypothetical protein
LIDAGDDDAYEDFRGPSVDGYDNLRIRNTVGHDTGNKIDIDAVERQ